jgi:2-octaprenyl-6-methoxyphenol hydroxylase
VLALLLARNMGASDRFTLVDRAPRGHSDNDPRAIALSAGSLQLLDGLIDLSALPGGAIRRIHVSQRGHFGRTEIRAADEHVDRLGTVVHYGALMRQLDAALERNGVRVMRPADDSNEATAGFDGVFAILQPQAWIHAEGGAFKAEPGAEVTHDASRDMKRDYAQTAIVCEVQSEGLPPGTAWERFCDNGPLALLPLPEPGQLALVWCEEAGTAARLAALDDATFLTRLQEYFGMRAGCFSQASPRHTFALGLVRRNAHDADNTVRIGSAAQTLHPVAGQGMNLGLRDAQVLAHLLGPALEREASLLPILETFDHARARDRSATVGITDFLARSFALPSWAAPLRHVAGLGLVALDAAPALRSALARRLMFGVRN